MQTQSAGAALLMGYFVDTIWSPHIIKRLKGRVVTGILKKNYSNSPAQNSSFSHKVLKYSL